jgi:hypothetical protein
MIWINVELNHLKTLRQVRGQSRSSAGASCAGHPRSRHRVTPLPARFRGGSSPIRVQAAHPPPHLRRQNQSAAYLLACRCCGRSRLEKSNSFPFATVSEYRSLVRSMCRASILPPHHALGLIARAADRGNRDGVGRAEDRIGAHGQGRFSWGYDMEDPMISMSRIHGPASHAFGA